MKTGWLVLVAVLTLAAGGALAQAPQAPGSSELVKLEYLRYEGRYYEIARLPTFQERNCAADTVMTFLRRVDGDVSIVYQCFTQDNQSWIMDIGLLDVSHGDQHPGELYVRPDLIGWAPWMWGTYRLIELAGDYSYAMVGDAAQSRLWILSRTRNMNEETYSRLLRRATERGFDTTRLVRSVQSGL